MPTLATGSWPTLAAGAWTTLATGSWPALAAGAWTTIRRTATTKTKIVARKEPAASRRVLQTVLTIQTLCAKVEAAAMEMIAAL